jgi:tRNA G18 (ribose-2'-O)-methylase SpoU
MHFNRKLKNEELNRISLEEFKQLKKLPVTVVLDNIRSALNVGSVFRTSDAFAIERLILCGITATPPHKEINKTALGSTESVVWEYVNNSIEAIQQLKNNHYKIVVVEQAEKKIFLNKWNFSTNDKIALVFGNEVDGVSQSVINVCDEVIEIPQFGTKHSLNVAVSVGIVLWEYIRCIDN